MLRFFRNKLIVKILGIYIILIVIPLLILSLLVAHALSSEVTNSSEQLINSNLRTISLNIDEILKNVEFSFNPIFTNRDFLNDLRWIKPSSKRTDYDDYILVNNISDFISKSSINNNYIDSVYLYSDVGKTFFNTRNGSGGYPVRNNFDIESTDWYNEFASRSADPSYNSWLAIKSVEDNRLLLSDYKEIRDMDGETRDALVSINVSADTLQQIVNRNAFGLKGFLFVTDAGGTALSNSDNMSAENIKTVVDRLSINAINGTFRLVINKEAMFVSYYKSNYTGFIYVFAAPSKEINAAGSIAGFYSGAVFFFIFLIMIVAMFMTYFYLYKPIRNLFSAMREFEGGDFKVKLTDKRSDEIGYINKNFNSMVSNLDKLVQENYVNKLLKKDAELKSIVSQINEHFLFNTLDAIHWKAREYNTPEVCDIIFHLSKFYRLTLSSGKDIVRVRDVMEIIKSYIYIQKFRMQELLEFDYRVDNTLLDERVLKYLFQPIVENAIVHGIGKKPGGGKITVTFERLDECIMFQVEDNGIGISAEKLAVIRRELDDDNVRPDDCFALKNINAQIKLFYGSGYSLSIESAEGENTRVWFVIPFINQEDRDV